MNNQMIETRINDLEDRINVLECERDLPWGALMALDHLLGLDTEYSDCWLKDEPTNIDAICRIIGAAKLPTELEGQALTFEDLRPHLVSWKQRLDDKIQAAKVILAALLEDD